MTGWPDRGAWASATKLALEVGVMPGEDIMYWARDVGYSVRVFRRTQVPTNVWVPEAEDGADAACRLATEWRLAGRPRRG